MKGPVMNHSSDAAVIGSGAGGLSVADQAKRIGATEDADHLTGVGRQSFGQNPGQPEGSATGAGSPMT